MRQDTTKATTRNRILARVGHVPVRKRFLAGVLLIVLPFILLSALEMAAFQRSAGAFERAAHHARRQLAAVGDVKESVLQVPLSLHEYLRGNVAKLNEFALVSGRAHRQVGRLALALDEADEERRYAQLNATWLDADAQAQEAIDLRLHGGNEQRLKRRVRSFDHSIRAVAGVLDRLDDQTLADVDRDLGRAAQTRDRLQWSIWLLSALALALALTVWALLAQSIIDPVRSLHDAIVRFSKGEFGHRVRSQAGDELGAIGRVLDRMAARIEETQSELAHRALHDELTGLPNRALFRDRVQHALVRTQRAPTQIAVMFLDLDDFKSVNDTQGHAAGDRLLKTVAERLRGCLRSSDTVARLGGDEFAFLLEEVTDEGALKVAERVEQALAEPVDLEGRRLHLRGSLGLAFSADLDGPTDELLLRNADIAMYQAKARGKGAVVTFEPGMHDEVEQRLALTAELNKALDEEWLEVHYQPIMDLATGRIEHVEALLRWNHPTRGRIPPNTFIPLAEESGAIVALGEWVLETACSQVRRWQEAFEDFAELGVHVNISARHLRDPHLVDHVDRCLRDSGLAPGHLTIEITESLLAEDSGLTVARLSALKQLGIRLAIDDFGTGYSSLSYLRNFPIDVLKIDRAFVKVLEDGPEEAALARAIVKIGQTLDLLVVAEGIETPQQEAELIMMGCRGGQGFLYQRPVDAKRLELMLGSVDPVNPRLRRVNGLALIAD